MSNKTTYYQRNREKLLNESKEFENNIERLQEKIRLQKLNAENCVTKEEDIKEDIREEIDIKICLKKNKQTKGITKIIITKQKNQHKSFLSFLLYIV